jgi:hypothetical protein
MRKASTEPRAKPKLTMADVFRGDAFSRSRSKGLTTQRAFRAKVRAMIAQIEKHTGQTPLKIGKYGVPMTTERQTLELRDIIQTALFRRKLLQNPKAAAMIAKEMQGTRYWSYFTKIAKKAAKRAERKKLRKILATKKARGPEEEKQTEIIRKIAERRRGIQMADRQWAARRKKPH